MKKEAVIICNGSAESAAFLRGAVRGRFVICADGGADTALKAGITPDVVIGDFDSVSARAKAAFKDALWIQMETQNNTDLEKALDYARIEKFTRCVILCAAGGRLDFTLSNLTCAFNYKNIEIVFLSEKWAVYPLQKSRVFESKKGVRVSIMPLGRVSGVTLKGLKYKLDNYTLSTQSIGTSNMALGKKFEVRLKKGNLLVYIENQLK